jgi:hypothetical protein
VIRSVTASPEAAVSATTYLEFTAARRSANTRLPRPC